MSEVVWLDGAFTDDPRVSIFDRGYVLGDSIFETMRIRDGEPRYVGEHLSRLRVSSELTGIAIPDEAERIVRDVAARTGKGDAYCRVTASRGVAPPGLGTRAATKPTFSVMARPLPPQPTAGIKTTIAKTRRVPAACLDPRIKPGSALSSVLARREVEENGYAEAIQLSVDGDVVCGCASNVFVVRADGVLVTPWLASGCRAGVTREHALAKTGAREERVTVDDLRAAREIFFTSTLVGVLPATSLDDRALTMTTGLSLREALS